MKTSTLLGPFLIFFQYVVVVFFQIGFLRFLDARWGLRKGAWGTRAGALRPWRRTILQMLGPRVSFQEELPQFIQFGFLALACALLPSFLGEPLLQFDRSWLWFFNFLILASILPVTAKWILKLEVDWVPSLSGLERKAISVVTGVVLLTAVFQQGLPGDLHLWPQQQWLVFKYPILIAVFICYWCLGVFQLFSSPFGSTSNSRVQFEWSFGEGLGFLYQFLWAQFAVYIFLGGTDNLAEIGGLWFFIKSFILWASTQFFNKALANLREDQSERIFLRYFAPIIFSTILIVVINGVYTFL